MVIRGVIRTDAGAAAFSLLSPVEEELAEPAVAVATTAIAELALAKDASHLIYISSSPQRRYWTFTYVESLVPSTICAAPLKLQAVDALFWLV